MPKLYKIDDVLHQNFERLKEAVDWAVQWGEFDDDHRVLELNQLSSKLSELIAGIEARQDEEGISPEAPLCTSEENGAALNQHRTTYQRNAKPIYKEGQKERYAPDNAGSEAKRSILPMQSRQ